MANNGLNMNTMSWNDLTALRNSYPPNSPMQAIIAPYEHQAYAREYTQQNPVSGAIGLSVATPAYALAKFLGLAHGRTAPSMAQVGAGYSGIGQGLMNWFNQPGQQ